MVFENRGATRQLYALQSGVDTQTMDDIDRGNHPAFDAESFGERRQLRGFPLSPEPDRRRLAVSFSMAFFVYGVLCQYRLGSVAELQQARRAVALRHIRGNFLISDIVRRRGGHFLFAVTPDHQMAVTDSGKKLDAVTTELAAEVTDHRRGFFGRNMLGGKIFHESFIA